jgi:hypothetical protein
MITAICKTNSKAPIPTQASKQRQDDQNIHPTLDARTLQFIPLGTGQYAKSHHALIASWEKKD